MIADLILKVETGLAKLDASKLANMEAIATIDFPEHFAYQTLQSTAFASGRINQDVATFLFRVLGSSPDSFNGKPLASRLVALQMIGTLAS